MANLDDLVRQLSALATEQVNPNTVDIDRQPPEEIARRINREDQTVAAVVEQAIPRIARAAEQYAATLRKGGRVFYIGAGTSGRLGVLDAAECPPTFGTDPDQIIGVISGGYDTLVLSREGVEDDREAARRDLQAKQLSRRDMVIGIAASTRTPYTLAALGYAKEQGCATVFVACNTASALEEMPDVLVELPVGPEVITGSTRMKSGTAQKMALNMISTTAMVLLGKTFGNLMVDLQARSEKLEARSRKMLMDLCPLSLEEASALLKTAGGSVKLALAMHQLDCSAEEARTRLEAVDGFLSKLEK